VLAEAQAVFLSGSLMSRRIECERSMHDWDDVASNGFAAIFRAAEETMRPVPVRNSEREQGLSNEARPKRS
jgi:hypothetical protein